jgi:pyridoxal phosphate enzyme (YggS family)
MPESPPSSQRANDGLELSAALVRSRLDHLRERVLNAGGDLSKVRILAVAKTFPVPAIRAAIEAGLFEFGENYADELIEKAEALRAEPQLRWHFIGNIQRNKVARLAPFTSVFEGVTRLEEGEEIARRAPGATIYVEVDATGLVSRRGVSPEAVPALVDRLSSLDLSVDGLMTVAAPGGGTAALATFTRVAALCAELGLSECSMGMSEDLELAVAAGSTEVRVGSALFGPRGDRR